MANIFVGNMSFNTTEDELRALFEPFGEITHVDVPTDGETGRARGFAFVEMVRANEAAAAIAGLAGKELDGRSLEATQGLVGRLIARTNQIDSYVSARLLEHAAETFGSRETARRWLSSECGALNNRTPLAVTRDNNEAEVERILTCIDYGMIA